MHNKEILIVDKLVIGFNHIVFNTAITRIIANIYAELDIVFICESTHGQIITENNNSVSNLKIETYKENHLPAGTFHKIILWVIKKIGDIFFIKNIFNNRSANSNAFIFTCLSASSLLYAGFRAQKADVPVFFFLHGELEYIFNKDVGTVSKIRGKIYKLFLKNLSDTSRIILLSGNIKRKLISEGILPSNKIIAIEHPIILTPFALKPLSNNAIKFGHIGIALKKKSSNLFFELAARQKQAIERNSAEFILVGKIEDGFVLGDLSNVTILAKENASLKPAQYEENIKLLDYSVFTFTKENYVYRVSGSLMDAINYVKPIIALKHSYFDYLFDVAGNIGFLCDDIQQMNETINAIIRRDHVMVSQYMLQQINLVKLRENHSVEMIEAELSALVGF